MSRGGYDDAPCARHRRLDDPGVAEIRPVMEFDGLPAE